MIGFIRNTLSCEYGLSASSIKEVACGWSASAFAATTDKGKYFVKVYDKHRPSVKPWIERMAFYMPTLLWLSQSTPLKDRISAPVLTQEADYQSENEGFVSVVFPFVEGQTLCDTPLTSAQTAQLAETLALLHSYGKEIPVQTKPLKEDYSLPFLANLELIIHAGNTPPALRKIIQAHSHMLRRAIDILKLLAEHMGRTPQCCTLCHTDLHGWNLMWHNRLILIDWEGLRLAPVESDLFSFCSGFFFDYAKSEFFAAYKKARPEYVMNDAAMDFYCLRRRMEDISEFCHSIAKDNPDSARLAQSLSYLQRECEALDRFMTRR